MDINCLYISYTGLLEPLGASQIIPYLKGLSENGIHFTILSFEKPLGFSKNGHNSIDEIERRLSKANIKWIMLRYHKRLSVLSTLFDVLNGVVRSLSIFYETHFDLIHARAHVPALIGFVLHKLLNVPFIFDHRGLMAEEFADNGTWKRGSLLYHLTRRMERLFLKEAEGVVVLTHKLKSQLTNDRSFGLDPQKIEVIPCCVDMNKFCPVYKSERPEPFKGKTVMVYAGSTGGLYLIEEMLDFFTILLKVNTNAFFLILTTGDASTVQSQCKKRGIPRDSYLVKRVSLNHIPIYLQNADFGISFRKPSPALIAASPVKISEYLACGLPVVSNAGIGDMDNLIQKNGVGIVIGKYDLYEYERSITEFETIFFHPILLRQKCRSVAMENFSLELGVDRYEALYKSIIDSGCKICRSNKNVQVYNLTKYQLRRCKDCGFVYNPKRKTLRDAYAYYANYYNDNNLSPNWTTEKRYKMLLQDFNRYRLTGKILDVGCGSGHFLKVAYEMGWKVYGTEISASSINYLSKFRYLNIYAGDLPSLQLPAASFDVVTMFELIEHVLEPVKYINEVFRILRPGGTLYITTPNFNALTRWLIGQKWRVICEEHLNYFTKTTLQSLLRNIGFSKIQIKTENINPHEILRNIGCKWDPALSGRMMVVKTNELREIIESNMRLQLAKNIINNILSFASWGDTIKARVIK